MKTLYLKDPVLFNSTSSANSIYSRQEKKPNNYFILLILSLLVLGLVMLAKLGFDMVLKTEIELLGNYPLMPENLARAQPLLFPPLNIFFFPLLVI